MNDEEDLVERQKEIDAIQARYATRADEMRPSYGARILAILLLSFVAPFLLFLGLWAVAMTPAGPLVGPIALLPLGVAAFVAYKGVRSLWMAHDPSSSLGWMLAFLALALAVGGGYIWASQPLNWHN
jgi:hypothetical protein